MPVSPTSKFFEKLAQAAPRLRAEVGALTKEWLSPVLADNIVVPKRDKQFNDPIWGTITLHPWEVALLDTQLVQRLRGVKQLGMAHLVFSGATHDRFAHLCGAVEAASRMLESLEQNAASRRRERTQDDIGSVTEHERNLVRLAALIHDVGHGPFSHTVEPVVKEIFRLEFDAITETMKETFANITEVSVSEAIAVLIITSDSFCEVLSKPFMSPVCGGEDKKEIAYRLAAAVVGGSDGTLGGCLSAIVSNQIDGDKLDYMARDAHHAGLPVDFDTDRLIRKLELLVVDEPSLLPRLHGLKKRVREHTKGKYFEIGLGHGGTGAFEQMLVGRIFLYDRLYHHHKVRTADAMARRLIYYASPDMSGLNITNLYASLPDDSLIRAFGGGITAVLRSTGTQIVFPVTAQSKELSEALLERRLFKRAFAFAGRFVAGLNFASDTTENSMELSTEDEKDAERSRVMDRVNTDLADFSDQIRFEKEIAQLAKQLGKAFQLGHTLRTQAETLGAHHVIIDLPKSPYPARVTIIARMDDGGLDVPDLFYDPARWAEVYNIQRRTGYVFSDSSHIDLVALAARVWFLRKFSAVFDRAADRFSKTAGLIQDEWLDHLLKEKVLTDREHNFLKKPQLLHVPFAIEESHVPKTWSETNPGISQKLSDAFNGILPDGIPALAELELRAALRCLFQYAQTHSETGVTDVFENEAQLQADVLKSLKIQGLDVVEGSKRAGGETDLVVGRRVVIENKIIKDRTDDPFTAVPRAGLQGRRYVLPTGQKFVITVVAYSSKSENGKLAPSETIRIQQLANISSEFAEIRIVVRFGDSVPSLAKANKPSKSIETRGS